MKEDLRLLLKLRTPEDAETELNRWMFWASHSRIKPFIELYRKIKRNKKHILNAIRLGLSNARREATNNKIKLEKIVWIPEYRQYAGYDLSGLL